MDQKVGFDELDEALRRCGANWDAAQTHGLLTGRLTVVGVPAGPDWLLQVLEGTNEADALRAECQQKLDVLYQGTYWQLTERLSEFEPLLPDDDAGAEDRTRAMAHWYWGAHLAPGTKYSRRRLADFAAKRPRALLYE